MSTRLVVVMTGFALVAAACPTPGADSAELCADGSAVVPADGVLKPGQTRSYAVYLSAGQAKAAPALKLAAYLVFPGGEAGMASVLRVTVNSMTVDAKCHPDHKPKTFSMPNHHSRGRDWPLYDPAAKAWVLFYDRDVLPAGKEGTYYAPGIKDYLYTFPVGKLWRTGRNVIDIANTSTQYQLRVLAMQSHDREFERAAERFQTVPTDRLLSACRAFPGVKVTQVKKRFLLSHKLLESLYNGDGSWGKGYSDWPLKPPRPDCRHPLIRYTGRPVLGYLIANRVEPDELYLKRAKEGLEWLLREQTEGGAYKWYWTPAGSVDANSLYDTAIAGRALVAGYEQFDDQRYLDASAKAARWAMAQPVSGNANYDFFTVWHLAAHYRVTKDNDVLASAVRRAVRTLKGQLPNGMWSDHHNQHIYYHAIITRGLVELLSVLDKGSGRYEMIRKAAVRAVNHMIAEQAPDGSLRKHPVDGGEVGAGGAGFATPVLVEAERRLGWDLKEVLRGLVAAPMGMDPKERETWVSGACVLLWWQAAGWDWAAGQAG